MNLSVQQDERVTAVAESPPLADPASLRANTYGLLALLLSRPPLAETLSLLQQIRVPEQAGDGLELSWKMLQLASEHVAEDALDNEFHACFIGIGRGELVPYGSWYMTGMLMDRPLALLRQDLAALGIERQQGISEPEDHVAAVCDAMSLLVRDAADDSMSRQRRFFDSHIAPWMGRFFKDLQVAKTAGFYRVVGRLGEQFIAFEQQYLSMAD